jgi:Tfp pilus assembly protein PilF
MKRLSQIWLAFLTALWIAGTSGCAALSRTVGLDRTAGASLGDPSARPDELPKAQTMQVCLTTAEQLAIQGHAREAALLYERARGIDPNAINYSRRLAGLYDLQGDLPKAATEFQAALATSPDDADLLNDFACFLDRQGKHAEAEQHLQHALQAAPQHQRALTNLGIVLAHQNRYQESFDAFAAAVGPAAAHSNVGMLLARQGKTEDAKAAFSTSLRIDPDLAQAQAGAEYVGQ